MSFYNEIELQYRGDNGKFVIDLSSIFDESGILPANIPLLPEIALNCDEPAVVKAYEVETV